jgi:hypothetical protein
LSLICMIFRMSLSSVYLYTPCWVGPFPRPKVVEFLLSEIIPDVLEVLLRPSRGPDIGVNPLDIKECWAPWSYSLVEDHQAVPVSPTISVVLFRTIPSLHNLIRIYMNLL